jgi:hypothetical protein
LDALSKASDVSTLSPEVNIGAPDANTAALEFNIAAPDINAGAPEFNITALFVNTGALEFNMGAPDNNIAASGINTFCSALFSPTPQNRFYISSRRHKTGRRLLVIYNLNFL